MKIKCVSRGWNCGEITIGKVYDVISQGTKRVGLWKTTTYTIINDRGEQKTYPRAYFTKG